MPKFRYGDHEEVADLMRNGKNGEDYVIVDVRDSDFRGGNITGACGEPDKPRSQSDAIDELVGRTRDVPKIVFHCALSQQRGPKYAKVYAQEVERRAAKAELKLQQTSKDRTTEAGSTAVEKTTNSATVVEQEIIVLRGGFTRWQEKYKDDPMLVENWRASVWGSGYNY